MKIMDITIVKRTDNLGNHEFNFSNGAWVNINEKEGCFEYQRDLEKGASYFEGGLEIENDKLIGYDGCFSLPKEVIMACRDLGMEIDEYIED